MAIAGAALIDVPQEIGYLYEENGLFSVDGHCHPLIVLHRVLYIPMVLA